MLHIIVEDTCKEIWKGEAFDAESINKAKDWITAKGLYIVRKEEISGRPYWFVKELPSNRG